MLGFATRAGKVIFGTEQVIAQLRKKAELIKLVLTASDASEGTKKKIKTKCEFYSAALREIGISGSELGDLLGKSYAPAVVAITDDGFANEICAALDRLAQNG